MAEGESLRSICRDPGMPSEATVRGWSLRDHDGFDARYRQRACCSWTRGRTKSWIAPKRYGDRLLLAGDAASPLQVMHQQVSLDNLTDEQLDALERFTTALMQEKRE